MIGTNGDLLRQMKTKIDGIENLVHELQLLGGGVPAIEKNAQCILSFTHALQFGISDIAEVEDL
ncbi:MAG: hypothetical protein WAL98_10025 [Desulfatiglandaceae bacterium]|jgi:hypothetical protein